MKRKINCKICGKNISLFHKFVFSDVCNDCWKKVDSGDI